VKHLGLASVNGRYDEALQHLASVNGWTLAEAERYAGAAFARWEERSRHPWKVDVGVLASEEYRRWIERRKRHPARGTRRDRAE
jgi:hypothetical protein